MLMRAHAGAVHRRVATEWLRNRLHRPYVMREVLMVCWEPSCSAAVVAGTSLGREVSQELMHSAPCMLRRTSCASRSSISPTDAVLGAAAGRQLERPADGLWAGACSPASGFIHACTC